MKCRKRIRRCQNRGLTLPPGSARENPEVCPSGIRHVDGAKLSQALVWNVRTWPAMLREKAQAAPTARPKVPMRRRGADCLAVAMKRVVMLVERRGQAIAICSGQPVSDQPTTGGTRCRMEGGSLHAVA